VFSTVILLVTYVAVTTAVVAFAGLDRVGQFEDDPGIFGALGTDVLGSPLDKLVVLAIVTSALASTQTTILPASRTSLSMARQGAFPESLGRVHPRFLTPHVGTIAIGVIAAVWYGVFNSLSQNFLYDSLTALSLMIAFYYALTGVACAVYYRRELTKSVKNFIFIGVGPLVGAAILAFLFVKAVLEYSKTDQSYSGDALFGLAIPAVLGLGLILLGVILMLFWRAGGHERFFSRRPETVDPDVAAGRKLGVAAVPEEAVT
jgi:amino acid transporter